MLQLDSPNNGNQEQQQQTPRLSPEDKHLLALVDYVIRTDWRRANGILNKYGYPQPEKFNLQILRANLLDCVKRYGSEAVHDVIAIETPYKKFVVANEKDNNPYLRGDVQNLMDGKNAKRFWGGDFARPFPTYEPYENQLDYNVINPYHIREDVMPRTAYEGWIGRLSSGVGARYEGYPRYNYNPKYYSSFSGQTNDSSGWRNILAIMGITIIVLLLARNQKLS